MKLPKGAKPSRALSRDGYRPMLSGASLEIEDDLPVLYATNSYTFLRLPIVDFGLRGDTRTPDRGPIPAAALRHMERGVEWDAREDGIRVGITTYDRVYAEGADDLNARKYPEMGPLIPEPEEVTRVSINAKLLADLAAGMGASRGVILTFDKEALAEGGYLRAVRVTRSEDGPNPGPRDPLGLIMPIRPPDAE